MNRYNFPGRKLQRRKRAYERLLATSPKEGAKEQTRLKEINILKGLIDGSK